MINCVELSDSVTNLTFQKVRRMLFTEVNDKIKKRSLAGFKF